MQNLKVALFLSFKSLTKGYHKATIVLIIFILSLSFINLVFISSILYGVIDALNASVVRNLSANIVIDPQEKPVRKDYIPRASELQRQIERIPGIVATSRHYKLVGTTSYDKEKNGKLKFVSGEVIGVDPDEERHVTHIHEKMVAGKYLEGTGVEEILLGADLAGGYKGHGEFKSLGGAHVGDKVKVTYTNGLVRDYKVKGIFQTKLDLADGRALITAKEAQSILSTYDTANYILVKTAQSGAEDHFARVIKALVPNLEVRIWTDFTGMITEVSKSFDTIIYIVSAIGLAVAAITIFILIYVNVVNKRRQIGILKAIGIKQSIIIYSYVFQALFFAVSGIIIGSLLVFYLIAPYFDIHPLRLPIGDSSLSLNAARITYGIIGLLVAALVAGFIPSRRAAKENILRAIWGA